MKSSKSAYLTFKPSLDKRKELANSILYFNSKARYKRIKNDKYMIFCPNCQKTYTIRSDIFKQIHASKICNKCFEEIDKFSRIEEEVTNGWIAMEENNNIYGYFISIKEKLGYKPKIVLFDQVLSYDYKHLYRKNCIKNMYCISRTLTKDWRKVRYTDYLSYFYRYDSYKIAKENMNKGSKKSLYENYYLESLKLKDNQKQLIKNNLFNRNQIKFIKLFNIKKVDDLLKYRTYIKNNIVDMDCLDIVSRNIELNEYYLHYLWKNKIKLSDFIDYVEQCKYLNIKVDKPKDFQAKHSDYSKRITYIENQYQDKKILKRYKNYLKYKYDDNQYNIYPFKSSKEIIDCGETLHNCIGRYVDSYADGKTILFYLTKKGRLEAAIEINKGRLIQARTKFNYNCSKNQLKHIKKWLKQNGWKYA